MKISVENGTVVCSLDNKSGEFLSACTGLFNGFYKGKLKMFWDNPEEWRVPEAAICCNARRLEAILRNARKYGVEADESVIEVNSILQALVREIEERKQAKKAEQEQIRKWEQLYANGCEKCLYLAYDLDLPICKQTGEILREKNVQKFMGGVLRLFNFEPFPSEGCPFNINKKQGENHERLSETCGSKA